MRHTISIQGIQFAANKEKAILSGIEVQIPSGAFVTILGENGAGKTTLLDLIMGFKKPTAGTISIDGQEPHRDHWELRRSIAYLSEKIDLPGDCSVGDYLRFNRFFYEDYSLEREAKLLSDFRVDPNSRIGNLSAGELRRAQLVASLSFRPKLIIIDEITAVLDIIGRQRLLQTLNGICKVDKCTILLATNILEDLVEHVSHVCIMAKGKLAPLETTAQFLGSNTKAFFSQQVVARLEAA